MSSIQEYKQLDEVPINDTTRWSTDGIPIPNECPDCSSNETGLTKYDDDNWSIECNNCFSVIENVKIDGELNQKYIQFLEHQI
jgi:hypothetical protein